MSGDTLNKLSARAIQEFEEVQGKYKEYYDKYQQEEANRRRFEAQFKQLKQVSLLAVAEYESLHKQYLTENQYRKHIEERLRKVTEENQEIRKQHKLGANTTIINQSNGNNGNGGAQETKGELEVLRAMKEAINNELRSAKNEVTKLKEELIAETQAHEVTRNQLELGVKQMKQLNRVSVLAFTEFNDLKKKLEVEETNRKTAEEVASEIIHQQQRDERKFSIIKEAAGKDDRVKKFLNEIDELNKIINKERHENQEKISELEEELTSMKDSVQIKEMDEKVSLLMEQLDISQKQVAEAEARAQKCETDSRQLYVRLAEAERFMEQKACLPPPPPPPPPPIAAPVIRKFITKIGKGRGKKGLLAEQEEDPRIEAMTQMIERIKKGVKLRSVNSPAKPEGAETGNEEGAMGELAGLLSNMRRGRRGTEDSANVIEEKPEPEFARVRLKKTGSIHASFSTDEPPANDELKQKLERQKSLADGINELGEEKNNDKVTNNEEIKEENKEEVEIKADETVAEKTESEATKVKYDEKKEESEIGDAGNADNENED